MNAPVVRPSGSRSLPMGVAPHTHAMAQHEHIQTPKLETVATKAARVILVIGGVCLLLNAFFLHEYVYKLPNPFGAMVVIGALCGFYALHEGIHGGR